MILRWLLTKAKPMRARKYPHFDFFKASHISRIFNGDAHGHDIAKFCLDIGSNFQWLDNLPIWLMGKNLMIRFKKQKKTLWYVMFQSIIIIDYLFSSICGAHQVA